MTSPVNNTQSPALVTSLHASGEQFYNQLLTDEALADISEHKDLIVKAFALSDFIRDHCLRKPVFIESLLTQKLLFQPKIDFAKALSQVLQEANNEQALFSGLRNFRHLHMLRIAWRDLLNMQDIEDSLLQVSELADQLITQANDWLYKRLAERYGHPMDGANKQALLIIGMGKLGGRELNFSSDIDLIFTYSASGETQGGRKCIEHQKFFTKLAQQLIAALHQTSADGQVFRVDMRLRPFGESGPLVMPFSAFEDYYQEQGRDWERYAMLKGRILNPEHAEQKSQIKELRSILKPFIYRRYIDFSSIDSLRKMKGLIQQEVRRRGLKDNIKLGQGGIREAEFVVQSLQLIRGGREPILQQQSLLKVLVHLSNLDMISPEDMQQIKNSYLYLRKVEHCLQQFDDKQTQTLPDNEVDKHRLAWVMNTIDYAHLHKNIQKHLMQIHEQFQELVREDKQESNGDESENRQLKRLQDLWNLQLSPEEAIHLLPQDIEPEQQTQIISLLEQFKESLGKRRLGERGASILNSLMPELLYSILYSHKAQCELLLARAIQILKAILGRTAYLELLLENPPALQHLLRLCAASPWVTDQIARFPMLLDELLNPPQLYQPTPLQDYQSELQVELLRVDPEDLEQQMEALRQFKLSQQLKIAAADIVDVLDIMQVSDHLTYLAEALIKTVVEMAWQQVQEKYGQPVCSEQGERSAQDMSFAVVAYGKAGGIELGYGSDLDLVFLHNCSGNHMTTGAKKIESQMFYLKLAQRILHLFTTKTASGLLYEIDMRLRPSGNAGLLVCHVNGFATYQNQQAWTWEHQALTRARFICGSAVLAEKFVQIRAEQLGVVRDKVELAQQVSEMREKMRSHLNTGNEELFDIKQDFGGMTDIEFLVQYYVLAYANDYPNLLDWSDNIRILDTIEQHALLSHEHCELLREGYLHYRNTGHGLTLQQQQSLVPRSEMEELSKQVRTLWLSCFEC